MSIVADAVGQTQSVEDACYLCCVIVNGVAYIATRATCHRVTPAKQVERYKVCSLFRRALAMSLSIASPVSTMCLPLAPPRGASLRTS